ncbi:triose-phosphate isomerase [uncultured Dialister sp.]|uniref:triose-phosphate isomerase n=1 Tax=uncultured Dialister sp. TaxID=278064 RepID=UPI0026751D90|nr:triose-phosphate isomerase [uncultured Dialister sp.]
MRKTLIAGNWKMNLTVTEAESFFKSFKIQKKEGVELLFCPPFTDIPITRFFLERSSILWGAQNVYPEDKGAFTGEISAPMLKDLGCSYVICGHSERRQILGESDELVARKVKAVLSHDMIPILCVGETGEERKEGQTEERIGSEIRTALFELSKEEAAKVVIAYEPIWAIGSGKAATPEDAEEIASFIRKTVKETAGKKASEEVRILYGGSVNGDNMSHFLKEKDIDGGLVGGASLKPKDFLSIYEKACE